MSIRGLWILLIGYPNKTLYQKLRILLKGNKLYFARKGKTVRCVLALSKEHAQSKRLTWNIQEV